MKNTGIPPLILITCIFAAFTIGIFAGRNLNPASTQIQVIPAASVSSPTEDVPATISDIVLDAAATEAVTIININTATAQQLESLPGIGEKTAEKIIAYRNEHGNFSSVTELLNVSGIGEKKLESIWDLVTTGG